MKNCCSRATHFGWQIGIDRCQPNFIIPRALEVSEKKVPRRNEGRGFSFENLNQLCYVYYTNSTRSLNIFNSLFPYTPNILDSVLSFLDNE